jgi:hypothetical protein
MMTQRARTADEIIEAAILELRRNRATIARLLPCRVTIHLPPEGSADPPQLEMNAKLKPGLSCGP